MIIYQVKWKIRDSVENQKFFQSKVDAEFLVFNLKEAAKTLGAALTFDVFINEIDVLETKPVTQVTLETSVTVTPSLYV